jgi:CheY-like chemotaxis protein
VHLLGIINDILDMSKLDADKLLLNSEPFVFRDAINRIARIGCIEIAAKKQKFSVEIDDAIPEKLFGDEMRYSQVLANLLNNAMKFTPDGGDISLDIRLIDEKDGVYNISCAVKDSGIGISEEQQSRLFRSFEQAESNTTRKYGGTGLGLSLSKRIANLLGGDLTLVSEPGTGSEFTFTACFAFCPDEQIVAETATEDVVSEADNFSNHTILLVEDVEINREIVMSLLEDTGIKIDCAENGAIAVQMFTAAPGKYELIFMDIQMPELDGYDATRKIRSIEGTTATPVPIVAMSANVFSDDVKKSLESGMNAHICKPIDISEVKSTLRKYLISNK